MFEPSEIRNRFGYHKPTESSAEIHKELRVEFIKFAQYLSSRLPGRKKYIYRVH